MAQGDLKFLAETLISFFKRARIYKALQTIDEKGITGWENWLEVELAIYFSAHDGISECKLEAPLPIDKRKEKVLEKPRVDFALRRKGFAKSRYIYLELKCANSPRTCVKNMLYDIRKLEKAKSRKVRSSFVIGVHHRENKPRIRKLIRQHVGKRDDVSSAYISYESVTTRHIPYSEYSFTIF